MVQRSPEPGTRKTDYGLAGGRVLVAASLMLLAGTPSALGCATCFGASDSKMAQGMNSGIVTLLVVVVAVLGGILSAGLVLAARARREAAQPEEVPARPAVDRKP